MHLSLCIWYYIMGTHFYEVKSQWQFKSLLVSLNNTLYLPWRTTRSYVSWEISIREHLNFEILKFIKCLFCVILLVWYVNINTGHIVKNFFSRWMVLRLRFQLTCEFQMSDCLGFNNKVSHVRRPSCVIWRKNKWNRYYIYICVYLYK